MDVSVSHTSDMLTLMCELGLVSCSLIVLHAKEFGDVFWLS